MRGLGAVAARATAGLVRERLEQLRAAAPEEAAEVDELWRLTIVSLDGPNEADVLGRSAWRMWQLLADELAERLADHEKDEAA